jgi:membrane-associated phospholipid phosphatase
VPTETRVRWTEVAGTFTRPYPVRLPMVVLVSLVPLYIFIADLARNKPVHVPELAWDRLVPLQPVWSLVYGALYIFLILLPVFVVRQDAHIGRTVFAYLTVWIAAYVCFVLYPTVAPRTSDEVIGTGFAVWGLQVLYSSDPPYNCFPSLHVAHSFVSALTCWRVHRVVGIIAIVCAALVGVSTVFTKQHYIADVIAGALLALVAYAVFLRGYPRERVPELDRRLAPAVALVTIAIAGAGLFCFWVVYRLTATR